MGLIIYHEHCLDCKYSRYVRKVKQLAKQQDIPYESRRVSLSTIWRDQATYLSDIELPFVYNTDTGASISLTQGELPNIII